MDPSDFNKVDWDMVEHTLIQVFAGKAKEAHKSDLHFRHL